LPRPLKPRMVGFLPPVMCFNPAADPLPGNDIVILGIDEWEALRLNDYLGLDQQECARLMNLAQSSFQRILASARMKLACAMVEGKSISIQGGNYHIIGQWHCQQCGHEWKFPAGFKSNRLRQCPSCGAEKICRRDQDECAGSHCTEYGQRKRWRRRGG